MKSKHHSHRVSSRNFASSKISGNHPPHRMSSRPASREPKHGSPKLQSWIPHQVRDDNIVYGKNAVYEALRAGARKVHKILFAVGADDDSPLRELIRQKKCPVEHVTREQLDRLTQGAVHQNCVAKVDPYPEYALFECFAVGAIHESPLHGSPKHKKLVLIVDCVQDPQNFGTLCRSALAFGVREVIIPKDRSVEVTPLVCKASSGAVEHLKIITVTNLARAIEEFKKHGFWVYGAEVGAQRAVPLPSVTPADKSAIVVGSEGQGLRRLVAESCDVLVKIPMAVDFDSLNVAQAGTVMMWEFWSRGNS